MNAVSAYNIEPNGLTLLVITTGVVSVIEKCNGGI